MSLFHLYDVYWKQKAFIRAQVAGRVLNSGFLSMKRLGVHRRVTPSTFAGTHFYTWVKRSTVRVKSLAQKHNTMTPARARTRTTRSGVEYTNHEAIASPRLLEIRYVKKKMLKRQVKS